MNKKIFSFGLFREGIKQLRIVGILAFVILGLEAILIPIGKVITIVSAPGYSYDEYMIQSVNAFSAHPLLVTMFCIFAPTMTLLLFGFLNKRNTSDFYHSIPHTRLCLYISFICSILAWVIFIIVGTTLLSVIAHLILMKYFTLLYGPLFMLAINSFVASVLAIASVAIAMTLSGTAFTNVVLSGLIIFLPRFVITIVNSSILSVLPMVPSGHLLPLLSNEYNAVTGTVFGIFTMMFGGQEVDVPQMLTGTKAMVYTGILALIYLVLAAVLFYYRKSESASRSAPNRFLQAVYRITVTMTICSIIIAVMFASRYDRYQEVFGYVVLYIIALVMYFTYEIITTKRWKNLLRAIPALAIVAALNFGLYGAMAAIHASQLNYLPSASSVKSVYLVSDNFYGGYYGGWGVLSFSDYARMQNSSVELKEKEVISIVADSLADCVDTFKARPRDYYYIYNSPSKGDGEGYNFSTFKIKTARGEKYRSIFVPLSKWDTILKAIEDNEDYKKLWMTLPEEIANTVYVQTDAAHIDGKKAAEIYAKMKEELKTADFVEWYQKVNMASERDALRAQVGVQTRVGSKTYHVRIPIIQSLMPESYTLFCKALYEYQKGNVQIVKDILANNKDAKTALGVTLFRYDSETKQHIQYGSPYSYMSEESYQEVAQFLLDYMVDAPMEFDDNYAIINIHVEQEEVNDYGEKYKDYVGYAVTVTLKDFDDDDLPPAIYRLEEYYYTESYY